MSEIRMQRKFI